MPVACANALGGVLIGNIIANDEPIATPINKVSTPPSEDRFSRILLPAMSNAQGQELARGASWGTFELAIPQALIAKQTAAVYTASGDLRLIDGVYQSKLEIFENACFVNGNYKGNPIRKHG